MHEYQLVLIHNHIDFLPSWLVHVNGDVIMKTTNSLGDSSIDFGISTG